LLELLALLGFLGSLAALFSSYKLMEVSEITDDPGAFLVALALAVLAGALLLEALDLVTPLPLRPQRGFHWGWRLHPIMMFLRMYDLSIIASSFYLVSYVLYFAGIYVSSKCSTLFGVPLLVLLYIDYNALSLGILMISALLTYAKLGSRGSAWTLFLTTLMLGHALSTYGSLGADPGTFLAGYAVRAIAPIIPICYSRCRK